MVLPDWAKKSKFEGVEAVTGASIDVGQYHFVWDYTATNGKRVKPGQYTVHIDTSYWPSMQYEHVTAPFDLGGKNAKSMLKGKLIPFMKYTISLNEKRCCGLRTAFYIKRKNVMRGQKVQNQS